MSNTLLIGATPEREPVVLPLRMANRHGLVAGATGTGKTITLQVLAESFSRAGVPVFAADIKGDLNGLASAGRPHPKVDERVQHVGITDHVLEAAPVTLWDVFGQNGHPVRTTVAEMGPQLLAHLLELNDTQEGVLFIAFQAAKDEQLDLLDLKDLRSLLTWMSEHAKDLSARYGNVSATSIGAIQRRLLVLEQSGGDRFFGEPALDIRDLMRLDAAGRGMINLLDGRQLMLNPRIYATFLFWLLTELFEQLPELGDPDQPVLVFFFDEAHLLFNDAPKSLLERIEQVVRLIRSKGVGVYFVTQSPSDIPDTVLAQLGNKVQHALRAFTEKDQKAVKAAASAFRARPGLDTLSVLTQLGVGEALVSVLDPKGIPTPVAQTVVAPPRSRIGPTEPAELLALRQRSPMAARYDTPLDRESAHEKLHARAAQRAEEAERAAEQEREPRSASRRQGTSREDASDRGRRSSGSRRQGFLETFFKSILRTFGSQLGRDLLRALVKALTGGRR